MSGVSQAPTPWAVHCPVHGMVYLTRLEYHKQMNNPDARWVCPLDGMLATWDDDNYDARSDV